MVKGVVLDEIMSQAQTLHGKGYQQRGGVSRCFPFSCLSRLRDAAFHLYVPRHGRGSEGKGRQRKGKERGRRRDSSQQFTTITKPSASSLGVFISWFA